LVGTQIYNPRDNQFTVKKGPIFTNLLLADEINRAPSKVQSALLEAMQEHQVTIGEQTFPLQEPFLVLATQNPIEQEGTYPLPEAQVDRFMLKLKINYPTREEERLIMDRMTSGKSIDIKAVVHPREILSASGLKNMPRPSCRTGKAGTSCAEVKGRKIKNTRTGLAACRSRKRGGTGPSEGGKKCVREWILPHFVFRVPLHPDDEPRVRQAYRLDLTVGGNGLDPEPWGWTIDAL